MKKICLGCGKVYSVSVRRSILSRNKSKYCSVRCYGKYNQTKFKTGHPPLFNQYNEKNSQWKGETVSYSALHTWLRKRLGTPKKCDDCQTTKAKRYEWANISHQYKRDVKDWKRLCCSCHYKFDHKNK